MLRKIGSILILSALCMPVTTWAEPAKKNIEQLFYCYGFYSATKSKKEVDKNNAFLKSVGDGSAYHDIINSPAYQKGYQKAGTMDRKQKNICYGTVYGFLGGGYLAMGKGDTKENLNLAYCMGYVNEARAVSDAQMVQEFCDTEKNLTPQDKKECLSELAETIKQNKKYQEGRREAKADTIHPVRVMNCVQKIKNATETDLDKAMGTYHKKTEVKPAKKAAPKKQKSKKSKSKKK